MMPDARMLARIRPVCVCPINGRTLAETIPLLAYPAIIWVYVHDLEGVVGEGEVDGGSRRLVWNECCVTGWDLFQGVRR